MTFTEKYVTSETHSDTELEEMEYNMQRSNVVLPRTEWPSGDDSQMNGGRKTVHRQNTTPKGGGKGGGTSLYWFTGVPEHLKLARAANKQMRQSMY